jgi:uroporphyrinogen decarboxylase
MHRFLAAARCLPVDRAPVWMMRQAGRYLPAYRKVRSTTTFLGLCKTPALATEVTLQPIDEFGMDAAILFSDILIPLEAMGLPLEFNEDGPHLPRPVRVPADVERLGVPDPETTMPFVMEAVRQIKRGLDGRVPLIGFCGAPFTLASYAVEGGGSKSYTHLKGLLFRSPEIAHKLLELTAKCCTVYLRAQVAAGAEAVQIFDTWAGILSPRDFSEFALRYARQIIDELRASPEWKNAPDGGPPIIYYPANGVAPYLEQIATAGADVVGIDWRIDLDVARKRLGPKIAVQGNLDPTALFLPKEQIAARVQKILEQGGATPGHVFNLGHGVLPETDPEHVRAMVTAVQSSSSSSSSSSASSLDR